LLLTSLPAVAQAAEDYKGRPLADALRELQAKGLRIVYSSATVTPDLRVLVEPRATKARQQLDELLMPHGLVARNGPGGTIEIVRGRRKADPPVVVFGTIQGHVVDAITGLGLPDALIRLDGSARDTWTDHAGRFLLRRVPLGTARLVASANGYEPAAQTIHVTAGKATVALTLLPASNTHREYISVVRPAPYRSDQGVASEMNLDRSDWIRLHGTLADDPVGALHAFPRVAAVDDFRSEFVVRGSPFRHVDLVVDGVSANGLLHTSYGRGATASLPMLAGHVLENATLRAGAYPRRYGDRLGPQLDLTIREGSRTRFKFRGVAGGTNATIVAEGPLGKSGRGSWLVATRRSYMEWPTERAESGRTLFGFSDGLAKFVYDLHSTQQVTFSLLGGTSNVDGDDNPVPSGLGRGLNRAAVANLSWRSRFGSSLVLRQRVSLLTHQFVNEDVSGRAADRGADEDIAYRADFSRSFGRGVIEGGAQAVRHAIEDRRSGEGHSMAASSWLRSGYAHVSWAVTPALTVSPGVRVTASTFSPRRAVSRWLLGEWMFRHRWSIVGSTGVSEQLADLRQSAGEPRSVVLRPEHANYIDAGIEQRLPNSMRWQATIYNRKQRDILREPDHHPRLVGGALVFPGREPYLNAILGASRGIELTVDRRSTTGLSGWISYSYGKSRDTDTISGRTYWSDLDQRHSLNVFAVYQFSPGASIGATFRTGSSFPIPAYLTAREGGVFVGTARNEVRMPAYARLDLRADRQLTYFGRRLTVFAELLNALNRANVSLAAGTVDPSTGQAIGFTDALFRRRVSAGVMVEF
jgi:hypothetical protein